MKSTNIICSPSSACRNTFGSFVCECLPGYSQNGSLGINTICDGRVVLLKRFYEVFPGFSVSIITT